jgi:hypothetical protein
MTPWLGMISQAKPIGQELLIIIMRIRPSTLKGMSILLNTNGESYKKNVWSSKATMRKFNDAIEVAFLSKNMYVEPFFVTCSNDNLLIDVYFIIALGLYCKW